MREIKFRAWDGKRMLNNVGFHPHIIQALWRDKDNGYNENDGGAYIISPEFTQYHLMQFTGLRDKNGREVYEGDIIQWRGHEVRAGKQIRPLRIHRVVWEIYDLGITANICNPAAGLDCEVIGNIYENPELLEEN